jgi:uncharacterized membrane protein
VGPVTVLFGILLIALGIGGYALPETKSLTALIPACFGLILVILGVLARQEKLRKHVMHAAAAVALVGLIAALVRLLPSLSDAQIALSLMALLCAVFVAICVRSFIMARRARTRAK